jgi:hypothetical protein
MDEEIPGRVLRGKEGSIAGFDECCSHRPAWHAVAKRRRVAGTPRHWFWHSETQGRGYRVIGRLEKFRSL